MQSGTLQAFGLPTRKMTALLGTIYLMVATSVPGLAQVAATKPELTIMPFAVADSSPAGTDLSKGACPATSATITNITPEDQTAIISGISNELQEKLSKTEPAQVGTAGAVLPVGTVVIAGCLTFIDGGNATKRLVGAGMGASLIKAHVQFFRLTADKPALLYEFDEEAKGRNFGVGSGMLINAMRAKKTSVIGDAASLGDKIAKTFEKQERKTAEAK